jgi:hypothetical protein
MSTRTKKQKAKRIAEFKQFRRGGGKLNNRGHRIGIGKNLNITGAGY